MLRAHAYTKTAKTSGRALKYPSSIASTATTRSARSHVTRDREREDGSRPGNSRPASVRDGNSLSRVSTRSMAASRVSAAHRDHLTIRASNGHGGKASTSGHASNTPRSNASMYSGKSLPSRRSGGSPAARKLPSRASSSSSSQSLRSRSSTINSRRPPSEISINASSNTDDQSVLSLTSTSMYTSSTHTTTIITDQYDEIYRDSRVTFYTDRFIQYHDLDDTFRNRVQIEDDLRRTYLTHYIHGAVQVDVNMDETYMFHIDTLTATIENEESQEAQRLRGGAGAAANELEIDAVVEEPVDNDRNARYQRREAQRNAAPDDNPGDDSDADDDDDDRVPGNNNPGGPGGNDNDDDDHENPPEYGQRPLERVEATDDSGGGDDPGDYTNVDIVVPDALGDNAFDYTDECRLIRRALYLCRIPDQTHAKYFIHAGINTFENLANYDGQDWKDYDRKSSKIRPCYAMTPFHISSLTAISLWVKVKIMHGDEVDVSSLSIQDVATLVQTEVCVDQPGTILLPAKLTNKGTYPTWKRQMYLYLESQLTKDDLRMSYIVRPSTVPAEYNDLMHELEFVIPNDGSTATSKRDSALVYGILHSNITDPVAKTRIRQPTNKKDGCSAWKDLEALYEGKDNGETRIRDINEIVARQTYTGAGAGNATGVTTRLINYYDELEVLNLPTTDANKLRHLRAKINMGDPRSYPYYINTWMEAVDAAILDHMGPNKTPISYLDWTTKLVNDEGKYTKSMKGNSARISAASTGGRDYQGGSSGGGPASQYDKSTGEPLDWHINGVNITLFYGNIDKMNSQGKSLPKVTREWFSSHKNTKCPQKFMTNAKRVQGTEKWKNGKKKRDRKVAAAAAARDGAGDAELCSSSAD